MLRSSAFFASVKSGSDCVFYTIREHTSSAYSEGSSRGRSASSRA